MRVCGLRGRLMDGLKMQIEQAEAQLKEIIANRPKVYQAWQQIMFHEDPAAYHKAYDNLYRYDVEKNKVVDEVKRLKKLCS